MVVYIIVCSETLKLYIGQHKYEDRLNQYLASKFWDAHRATTKRSYLYNAMRAHSRDSWSIHPLVSGIETKTELDEAERLLIYALKSQHPDVGYNICDGGEGFTGPHSAATKTKISVALIGHPVSANTRKKISASQPTKTLEQLAVLAQYRPTHSPWLPHGRKKGFRHSEETIQKMREAAKGRDTTKAARASATARKGKPWPLRRLLRTIAWG
jgi:hypothetical protein